MKKGLLFIWILFNAIALVGCTVGGNSIQVEGIEITSEENVHTLKIGETLQLNAVVYPTYINQKFNWSTNNSYVATVDENGLVTTLKQGSTKINVKSVANPEVQINIQIIVQ